MQSTVWGRYGRSKPLPYGGRGRSKPLPYLFIPLRQ